MKVTNGKLLFKIHDAVDGGNGNIKSYKELRKYPHGQNMIETKSDYWSGSLLCPNVISKASTIHDHLLYVVQ